MRLTDILNTGCIKVPLESTTKQAAIYELIDLLVEESQIDAKEELRSTVWQREETRSTGIGHGVAIPHGKWRQCKRLWVAIGKTVQPIDYGAIDGKPVELIFLLASPPDQTGPHIQALAAISRMLTDPAFRNQVKSSATAEELFELIKEHEERQAEV